MKEILHELPTLLTTDFVAFLQIVIPGLLALALITFTIYKISLDAIKVFKKAWIQLKVFLSLILIFIKYIFSKLIAILLLPFAVIVVFFKGKTKVENQNAAKEAMNFVLYDLEVPEAYFRYLTLNKMEEINNAAAHLSDNAPDLKILAGQD
jgi:hypothetical protein